MLRYNRSQKEYMKNAFFRCYGRKILTLSFLKLKFPANKIRRFRYGKNDFVERSRKF